MKRRISFTELQEIMNQARELLTSAITGQIDHKEFLAGVDKLIPEGTYYYNDDEQDRDKLTREIFTAIRIKRVIEESPFSACDRYKNWEVAQFLISMREE